MKGRNVHVCGAAGTGKSLLIKYVVKALRAVGKQVAVTALTGVAANNLNVSSEDFSMNATTLHCWMGAGLCNRSLADDVRKIRSNPAEGRWKNTDVLILDEISMVPPDLFTKIEKMARDLRGSDLPCGGLQLVFCGDWFQLEPIRRDEGRVKKHQF